MPSSDRMETDWSQADDFDLVRAIQQNNLNAFTALVERYQRSLINFFYQHSWDRQVAEDCAQEVFLKMFTRLDSYEPKAKFTTFLFRVARNLWIDKLRAARSRPVRASLDAPIGSEDGYSLQEQVASVAEGPVEELEKDERRKSLRRAVDRLSEEQKMVVLLSEFQGLKYQEIGEILEIPVGTVKSRMHTAVERLREILEENEMR
ncbi:MAG: sigma-70 family RNA polymerase sigma factor [Planctomycetota bacterium]|nr:sigma-70 family RNA polymerase sigma factor [Planctomycetota bacterium]